MVWEETNEVWDALEKVWEPSTEVWDFLENVSEALDKV